MPKLSFPTLLALGLFGAFIVVGMILVSSESGFEMPTNTPPKIVDMSDMGDVKGSSGLPILANQMPEFTGITKWWNTETGEALTPAMLKGKVVLIDFWTYSCINCIRTYPFLRTMHERYADKGLVIVGVHTPEFAFEKNPDNVGREIIKNDLKYPVALDPDFGTWNAYNNRYWPAHYFFDREGRLRHTHFGEGEHDRSEAVIRALLEEGGMAVGSEMETVAETDFSKIQTHETYFGLERGNEFMSTPGRQGESVNLTLAETVRPNEWTAGGTWVFQPEYIEAQSKNATFRFNVQAAKLHLVLESADGTDKNIGVSVDDVMTKELIINASDLYDIAEFLDGGRHTVEIRLPDGGVRFYAATFS
ncbi:redoxin domain-containing protein [Patescibacteria group bacterium]|jgi:thiol-disulfide isomerase/thioredoxin|nr:redoxin domain-containing protein [Patescibacteria group bacterium]